MNTRRLALAALIIAIIVFAGFALSVPHTRDVSTKSSVAPAAPVVPQVSYHDSYKKGVHSITGSVFAPNACATLSAESSLTGDASSSQSIVLTLSLQSDTGVCLQIPTSMSFSTSVAAPADTPIQANVNGEAASTTAS